MVLANTASTALPAQTPLQPNPPAGMGNLEMSTAASSNSPSLQGTSENQKWSSADDVLLRDLSDNNLSWAKVAEKFPDRTGSSCANRYRRFLIQGGTLQVGNWSEKEDAVLVDLISKKMTVEGVAKQLPGRTAAACRLRYGEI
jgi:hypothetical protein